MNEIYIFELKENMNLKVRYQKKARRKELIKRNIKT